MAVNFQSSTLSLTLSISCQICLGKVRQPVICANNHVFCSSCMEMWLKKASQCPTCRVSITAENPCREIIGGSNESDHKESPSTKKCLRKTRVELLFREYEDEIDGLIRENEELRNKNHHLESQLKTALDPCSINAVATDDKIVDSYILNELTNKLRAATDACEKVKQDMDKLKEANKALRSQNIDLVQENMRLKAEVASRSPQKFGRFTVAALEAKIQQYERTMDQLKRALERSDQYVEELESRITKYDKKCEEIQEPVVSRNKNGSEDFTQQEKINMMIRSLSDNERKSICSNPETVCRPFSPNHSLMFLPSVNHTEFNKNLTGKQTSEDLNSTTPDFTPSTPSSAFRSLTLKSPVIREKKVAFKPASFLRRLDFDEFPSPSKSSSVENQFTSLNKFPKSLHPNTDEEPKPVFWNGWHKSKPIDPSCPGPSKESLLKGAAAANLSSDNSDSFQMSSEASMDAAYLDKITELDSMMLDGESISSRGSQLSLASSPTIDLGNTLVLEPQTSSTFVPGPGGKDLMEGNQQNCHNVDLNLGDKEVPKGTAEVSLPASSIEDSAPVEDGHPHSEELSFELLFDALDENNDVVSEECQQCDSNKGCSSYCSDKPENTRERNSVNIIQPTKRKSYSPFNTSSPTKFSKLM